MLNGLKAWFQSNVVDDILKDFHAIVARLEAAVDFHKQVAAEHAAIVRASTNAMAIADAEAQKAAAVAEKVKALINA